MAERAKKKKRNPIVAYFKPFGLRQLSALMLIAGIITAFVGIIIAFNTFNNWVAIIGAIVIGVAALVGIYYCLSFILKKDVNKRDPEYRSAIVSMCFLGALLLLAVLGVVAGLIW